MHLPHLPPLPAVIHRSSRPLRRLLRWGLTTVAVGLVLLALLMSGLRLALPYFNEHRAELSHWLSQMWGAPVSFASIDVRFVGYRPQLILTEVRLGDEGPTIHSLGASLALWRSLVNGRPMIGALVLDRPSLVLHRSVSGSWQLVGAPIADAASSSDLSSWRAHLPDLGRVSIEQAHIEFENAATSIRQSLTLTAQARLAGHGWALSGSLSIPEFGIEPVEVRAQGRLDEPVATEVFVQTNDWRMPAVQKSVRDFGGPDLRQSLGGCAAQVESIDCAEGMPLVDQGRLTGALWLHFRGTALSRVQASFDVAGLKVSRMARIAGVGAVAEPKTGAALDAIKGRLRWDRTAAGWRLDVDDLRVRVKPGEAFPAQRLHVIHEANNTWFSADYADLRQLALWLATAPLPDNYLKLLGDNALTGQAEQVRLHFIGDQLSSGALQLKHFGNVPGQRGWPVVGGSDGLGGLSVTLFKQPAGWIAELNQRDLVLALPGEWREPITIQALDGVVYWNDSLDAAGASVLFSPGLSLKTADLDFHGRFRYAPATKQTASALDVVGQFADIPVARIPAYLPRGVMGRDAVFWLDHALPGADQTGRVTQGSLAFHGDPARFPFVHGGGWLAVNFAFEHLRLPYQPGWPVLEDAQGQMAFIDQQFHAALTGGTVAGVPVAGGRVSLFNLDHPVLSLAVRTAAPLPDLLHFVQVTPLLPASQSIQAIKTTGKAELAVDGSIGLDRRLPTTINGRLDLLGNGLSIPSAGLAFSGLKGALQFTNTQFSGSNLSGKFEGSPLQWSVTTTGKAPEEVTRITVNTAVDPQFLLRKENSAPAPLLSRVAGKAAVTATVSLPHQGDAILLHAQTDLVGVQSLLPAPLGKPADAAWPLNLALGFAAGKLRQLDLKSASQPEWQAHLRFGAGDELSGLVGNVRQAPDSSGLALSIDTPVFDWDAWQPLLTADQEDKPSNKAGAAQATPFDLNLNTAAFKVAGTDFGAVQLSLRHRATGDRLELTGAALAGTVDYQPKGADGHPVVQAQLARLYWPKPSAKPSSPPPPVDAWSLSRLPSGRIAIADLRRGEQKFGAVQATLVPGADEWRLDAIDWQPSDGVTLTGRAAVQGKGSAQRTVLTLSGTGAPLSQTLKQLLGTSPITGGKIDRLHLELNWPGSPDSYTAARLDGAGSLRLSAGQISEIDPGAGRLAGLLSLEALTKRLRLDFSDVLDRGLQFDTLDADWVIQHGVLEMAPLDLKNASLHLNASGRTNLADDSLDYRVNVYADVGMLLPIIGTVAGGPLVGGAVLAVQQAIKSLDKNPSPTLAYQITGTLDQPKIQSLPTSPTATP